MANSNGNKDIVSKEYHTLNKSDDISRTVQEIHADVAKLFAPGGDQDEEKVFSGVVESTSSKTESSGDGQISQEAWNTLCSVNNHLKDQVKRLSKEVEEYRYKMNRPKTANISVNTTGVSILSDRENSESPSNKPSTTEVGCEIEFHQSAGTLNTDSSDSISNSFSIIGTSISQMTSNGKDLQMESKAAGAPTYPLKTSVCQPDARGTHECIHAIKVTELLEKSEKQDAEIQNLRKDLNTKTQEVTKLTNTLMSGINKFVAMNKEMVQQRNWLRKSVDLARQNKPFKMKQLQLGQHTSSSSKTVYSYPISQQPSVNSSHQIAPSSSLDVIAGRQLGSPTLPTSPAVKPTEETISATPVQESNVFICPLCQGDFSHLQLDKFQCHVVDCCYKADTNQAMSISSPAMPPVRHCPVCFENYTGIDDEIFLRHVNTHLV